MALFIIFYYIPFRYGDDRRAVETCFQNSKPLSFCLINFYSPITRIHTKGYESFNVDLVLFLFLFLSQVVITVTFQVKNKHSAREGGRERVRNEIKCKPKE